MNAVTPFVTIVAPDLPKIHAFDAFECFMGGPVRIKAITADFAQRFLNGPRASRHEEQLSMRGMYVLTMTWQQGRLYDKMRTAKGERGLVDIWRALVRQPNGESGRLSVQGAPNVFFLRDAEDKLSAVNVSWDDGWHICTWPSPETEWPKNSRFFVF